SERGWLEPLPDTLTGRGSAVTPGAIALEGPEVAPWPYYVDAEHFFNARYYSAMGPPLPNLVLGGLQTWGSVRKWHLFACGCVREAWAQLTPSGREALGLAERFAEGEAVEAQLALVRSQLHTEALTAFGKEPDSRSSAASAAFFLSKIRRGPLDVDFSQWI